MVAPPQDADWGCEEQSAPGPRGLVGYVPTSCRWQTAAGVDRGCLVLQTLWCQLPVLEPVSSLNPFESQSRMCPSASAAWSFRDLEERSGGKRLPKSISLALPVQVAEPLQPWREGQRRWESRSHLQLAIEEVLSRDPLYRTEEGEVLEYIRGVAR